MQDTLMLKTTTSNVAFIGIGLMGIHMATNLLKAGHKVVAYNRTKDKAKPLLAHGATIADSAAEAVENADVVITMLSDGAAVTNVLFMQGVVQTCKPGTLIIDMSSIAPSISRDHFNQLEEFGVNYLDAPVSGGTAGAENASLAIMAGGNRPVFDSAFPLLCVLGKPTYVGPTGSGQLAKLANQQVVAITVGAVSEAMLLVEAGGGDPAAMREAISGGFAQSAILEQHGGRMVTRDYKPGFLAKLQLKDLDAVIEVAASVDINLPLTELVRERYQKLVEDGHADSDHSALMLLLEAENQNRFRVGSEFNE